MCHHRIWDPFLRIFHWALVTGFIVNALGTAADGTAHRVLGYVLAALIAFRLVWGIFGPRSAKFSSFLPSRAAIFRHLSDIATRRRRSHLGHSPLGALMIVNLLAGCLGIALTGWMLTRSACCAAGGIESLHQTLVVWVAASAGVHVATVLWESLRTGINLSKAMITGVKDIPRDVIIVP